MATPTRFTYPLTTLHDNSADLLHQLNQTQQPLTLAIDHTLVAIIQDVASYQRLLDLAALADESEGIRQAEEDLRNRPIEEFFAEFQSDMAYRLEVKPRTERDLEAVFKFIQAEQCSMQ